MSPDALDLGGDALPSLARWAAACAERALPVFEAAAPRDPRPRAAVAAARAFAAHGKRTREMRVRAWDALHAARAAPTPAARDAARAAAAAVSSAYIHPLATPHQARHILGPAVYAALAVGRVEGEDAGDAVVAWAARKAPPPVRALLRQLPPPKASRRSRVGQLTRSLDEVLRGKARAARGPATRRRGPGRSGP